MSVRRLAPEELQPSFFAFSENVGADRAVRFGESRVWQDAVAKAAADEAGRGADR